MNKQALNHHHCLRCSQPGSDTGDEPLYVNAKQYHRILKRRQARAKLEASGKIPKERQVSHLRAQFGLCAVLINNRCTDWGWLWVALGWKLLFYSGHLS